MRLGAAIIVAMGVCAAALILVERRIGPQLAAAKQRFTNMSSHQPVADIEELQQNISILTIVRAAFWLLDLAGIALLAFWFYKASHRKVRNNLPVVPPEDELGVMRRMIDRDQPRFQYGILTLLALTLAVALACSALVYPLD